MPTGLGSAFWRLWTSSTLSNLADGLVKVALPLVALRYTDSPTLIAGLAVVLTLPWLLFALPAGALADRLDRRRIMLAANTARAAALAALAAALAAGAGSIWLLYAVAAVLGTVETLHDTAAQSILPQLVPRDRLSRANGRLFAAEIASNAAWAVLVLYAVGPDSAVGLSEPGFGALLATSAAGMLTGSLVAERVERWLGRGRALHAATFACVLLTAGPALSSNAVLIGTAFFLSGTGSGVWN